MILNSHGVRNTEPHTVTWKCHW